MSDLREATLEWLSFEQQRAEGGSDWLLTQLAVDEGRLEAPPQPEPLKILYRLRRQGLSMCEGGYLAQPHILLMELDTCIDVEVELQNLALINARNLAQKNQAS